MAFGEPQPTALIQTPASVQSPDSQMLPLKTSLTLFSSESSGAFLIASFSVQIL